MVNKLGKYNFLNKGIDSEESEINQIRENKEFDNAESLNNIDNKSRFRIWKERSNKRLKEGDSEYRVYNKLGITLVIGLLALALIVFSVVYYVSASKGFFKSVYIDNSTVICETPIIPPCNCYVNTTCNIPAGLVLVNNSYSYYINTTNITIINNTNLT
jgi:hypothetical protein